MPSPIKTDSPTFRVSINTRASPTPRRAPEETPSHLVVSHKNGEKNRQKPASHNPLRALKAEGVMDRPHRQLKVFLVQDHGNLDLGGADHLNIDIFLR